MKIAVAVKIVPDDKDILATADGSLDYSKAKPSISTYDLNALEAAARTDAEVVAITAGPTFIDESKVKKSILARGVSELYMTTDDALADTDAFATAAVLANVVEKIGDIDLVLCGDGSADIYAQQVDVQLASRLGWPVVNAVAKFDSGEGVVIAERVLEDEIETVEVSLPAVVSVTPDIAIPRIPGMKDILSAGKKPMNTCAAGLLTKNAIETVDVKAPKQADRKRIVKEASEQAIVEFAAAIKAAL
ncbi:electron transfer flavoprotein [Adlercreutzia sp. ZJ138]|uniref:electron transfer flavoprotein n=1 Tax=Adlercreutzia sp. ZJ138 TaxID=2709405 RepID=UPI0013EE07DD|nr:electron transfer flavoprotein [Adlercreutzia sp. ZJ138]